MVYMLRQLLFLLPVLFLLSCSSPGTGKQLSGSDSLVITFNIPGTDSVSSTVSTTETKAIRKIAGFLSGKQRNKPQCGFGGNMIFYKAGRQVQPVVFRYDNDCRFFLYEMEGKVLYTEVSEEAAAFLKSLAEERNWY
ncbi:MAG: hypothetical protein HYZ15_05635 [Sphingobacteriales bacterium]|nr:hypothetical protein [Sphingobacteriales bacterium]